MGHPVSLRMTDLGGGENGERAYHFGQVEENRQRKSNNGFLRCGMTNNRNKQPQKRNAGVSPLRRQSAPPSVEMTDFLWVPYISTGGM
jgi:hypothetical protein